MARSILIVFFISFFYTAQAQFTYNPDPYSIVVSNCSDPYANTKENLILTVVNDTTYTIYWKIEFTNFKDEWQLQLCDLNFCYDYNARQSSPNITNTMERGNHTFQIGFYPKGIEGSGRAMLKLYGDNTFTRLVKEIPINLYACTTSSKDVNLSAIRVFPNPTTDYFQISNASQVNKVVIYNVLGKEVKTLFHYNSANHDISDLRKGIYMVRLLDSKNRVIKTIRLSKSIDGA
ncbi:MAG: T9SS type A sorting domain-containing protein [Saprospiraceae bacterium]